MQCFAAFGADAERRWNEAYNRSIMRQEWDGRGGALQPAESTAVPRRIALDGQAYSWTEFETQYGDHAQVFWDEAYERSMLRRFAPDGKAYTWNHFVTTYGADAQQYWDVAPPESPSVAEAPPVAKAPQPPAVLDFVVKAPPPKPPLDPVLVTIPESVLVKPVSDEVPKTKQDWTAIAGDGRSLRQPRRDASRAPVWPGLATEAAVAASAATGSSGSSGPAAVAAATATLLSSP
jgi:hypothetical protein